MNFPHATDEQISTARRMIVGFALRHGMQLADAEDAAQDVLHQCMTRQYRRVCPASLPMAVRWRLAHARRYGVQTLAAGDSTARSRHAAAVKRGDPLPPRDTAPAYADPAVAAEMADRYAGPDRKRAAARAGVSPAVFTLHALGWGPMDDDDTTKVTSTSSSGPGHTPPAKGCPGLSTESDPNPQQTATLRTVAPVALEGDNLAAYQAELARYYRGDQ